MNHTATIHIEPQVTSIFEGQPPQKTKAFSQSKQGVNLVSMYIYYIYYIYIYIMHIDLPCKFGIDQIPNIDMFRKEIHFPSFSKASCLDCFWYLCYLCYFFGGAGCV